MNKKIGFTCGSFDLFHAGHLIMLKEAKSLCDYLIVGLQTDPTIDRVWKNKPIQSVEERQIQLDACRFIDEIIVYDTEDDLHDIMMKIKPNLRIVGIDHKHKDYSAYESFCEFYYHKRNHSYSSTDLRRRIYKFEKNKRIKEEEEC